MQPTVLIENCYAGLELIVSVPGYSRIRAGGITGYIGGLDIYPSQPSPPPDVNVLASYVMIDRVTFAGTVDVQSNNLTSIVNLIYLGGIAGDSYGKGIIQNSEVTGTLKMTVNSAIHNIDSNFNPSNEGTFNTDGNKDIDFICGGIIGRMKDGHINNCHFRSLGRIVPDLRVGRQNIIGGIIGAIGNIYDSNEGKTRWNITAPVTVKDSSASGDISVTVTGMGKTLLGGAFGALWGTSSNGISVENCEYSDGVISFERRNFVSDSHIGGFGGEFVAGMDLKNCRSRARRIQVDYTGTGGQKGSTIGGFIVIFRGDATGCYSHSPIVANLGGNTQGDNMIGGFFGTYEGSYNFVLAPPPRGYILTDRCYAAGDITVTITSSQNMTNRIGGFAGWFSQNANIEDSYTSGNITVDQLTGSGNTHVGGFIGRKEINAALRGLYRCFATGSVTAKRNNSSNTSHYFEVGGLAGSKSTTGVIENSVAFNRELIKQITGSSGGTIGRISGSVSADGHTNNHAKDFLILYEGGYGPSKPPVTTGLATGPNTIHGATVVNTDTAFWKGLGFLETVWNLGTPVTARGYPILLGVGGQ
jgi:hypothetical protein